LRPRPGASLNPVSRFFAKTPDPAADLQARYAHPFGDLLLGQTLGAQQDDLGTPPIAHRHRAGAQPAPQLSSLVRPQLDALPSHDPLPHRPAK
jgi:hypothetical protein